MLACGTAPGTVNERCDVRDSDRGPKAAGGASGPRDRRSDRMGAGARPLRCCAFRSQRTRQSRRRLRIVPRLSGQEVSRRAIPNGDRSCTTGTCPPHSSHASRSQAWRKGRVTSVLRPGPQPSPRDRELARTKRTRPPEQCPPDRLACQDLPDSLTDDLFLAVLEVNHGDQEAVLAGSCDTAGDDWRVSVAQLPPQLVAGDAQLSLVPE